MSYLALARKWRPKIFTELVGQEHVVKALRNALDSGRVHHAFLFTGTRGVGKTTIARIFAKSLNCEIGVSSEPCGRCPVCLDVDAGRFVDLIEIDAASNTGVDDVRDLIDSAQYAPARGRYKVFLIDEVHMLSKNAFNALLKTLEEPPEHVKFLLATTDPQKLPVTVLSRCLQFSLRRLRTEEISGQMQHILVAEGIEAESAALDLLALAADGSLRDGLSLLDQAIAHGGGALEQAGVRTMLGSIDQDAVLGLLESIAAGDGTALYAGIEAMAGYVVDYGSVLDALASTLHRIQLRQVLPAAVATVDDGLDPARMQALAEAISSEDVQLYYQIAGHGRRDLDVAPTPRIGFEMTLLRMLAFQPDSAATVVAGGPPTAASAGRTTPPIATAGTQASAEPARSSRSGPVPDDAAKARARMDVEPLASSVAAQTVPESVAKAVEQPVAAIRVDDVSAPALAAAIELPRDTGSWTRLLPQLGLGGPVRMLADNCAVLGVDDGLLRLGIRREHEIMLTDTLRRQIEQAVARGLDRPVRIRFEVVEQISETPALHAARQQSERQSQAESGFARDPNVRATMAALDAQIVPGSVRPI